MERETLVNLLDQISMQCDPDNIDYTFPTVIIEDDGEAYQIEQRYISTDEEIAESASWLRAQCQSAEAALNSVSGQDFTRSPQPEDGGVVLQTQSTTDVFRPYSELIGFLDSLENKMQESQNAYLSERKDIRILSFLLDNEQAMQELVSIVSKSAADQNVFSLLWGNNDYLTIKKYFAENQQSTPAFELACTLFAETVLPNTDTARRVLEKKRRALDKLEQDAIREQFIFSWARYVSNPAITKAANFTHSVQLSLSARELTDSIERAGFIDRIKTCFKYKNLSSDYSDTLSLLRNSQEKCMHHLHDCRKKQGRDSYLYKNSDKIIAENSRTISIQTKRRQELAPQISEAERIYMEKKAIADEVRARRSKKADPYQNAVDRLQDQIDREKKRKDRCEESIQKKYDRIRKNERKINELEDKIYEYERKIHNSDEDTSDLRDSIDDFQERIDDLRYEAEGLEREIEEGESDVHDCECAICDLESELSIAEDDLSNVRAEFEPDLSPKRTAERQARTALYALNDQDKNALSLIQTAQSKIDECVHLKNHSEVLEEQALEISQTAKAIADSKEVIEQANQFLPYVQKFDTLCQRTRKNTYILCAISLSIVLVLTLLLTGIFSKPLKTASSPSHSMSYSQKQERPSSQSTSSSPTPASKDVDETNGAETLPSEVQAGTATSGSITTTYYAINLAKCGLSSPEGTEYEYSPTFGEEDGLGIGYETRIMDEGETLFYVGCFSGGWGPEGDFATLKLGQVSSDSHGILDVYVWVDAFGRYEEALTEVERYAAGINLMHQVGEFELAIRAEGDTATAEPVAETTSPYVLPGSDSRLYTREELEGLSDWELYIARNEIFARHGRQFSNADLVDYFEARPWYNGEYEPADFDSWFTPNEFEKANTDLILEVERGRNSPYLN